MSPMGAISLKSSDEQLLVSRPSISRRVQEVYQLNYVLFRSIRGGTQNGQGGDLSVLAFYVTSSFNQRPVIQEWLHSYWL